MSTTIDLDGTTLTLPTASDLSWDTNLNNTITAIVNKANATEVRLDATDSAGVTLTGTQTLTNKTLTSPTINGAAVSGTVTGTPNFTGPPTVSGAAIVTTTGTQTLTNKTLTAPIINSSTTVAPSIITFSSSAAAGASPNAYLKPFGNYGIAADGNEHKMAMPFACKLSNMYLSAAVGATGGTTTITVRKNGVDTSLAMTVNAATTTGSDLVNSVTFAAGDLLSVKIVSNAGVSVSMTFPIVSLMVTQA